MASSDTSAFLRVLDTVLPRAVADVSSHERTRARALVVSSVGVVLLGASTALIAIAVGQDAAVMVSLTTTIAFALVPAIYRITGSYDAAAWAFVLFGMGIAAVAIPQTGGIYSLYVFWLPMVPAVVLVVLDYRAAAASMLFVVGFAIMLVRDHAEGSMPAQPGLAATPSDIARVIVFVSLFFLAVSYARERALEDVVVKQEAQGRAHARAEAASRAKSSILASVSHELRTPMTGILGLTDLLVASDLDDQQREWARTVHKTGNALLALLDDLLDTARLDAGRLTLKVRPFRPEDLCEQVMALFGPRARTKALNLHLTVHADVPEKVRGDAARVRQVLTNLVGNAIKFTERGGVALEVTPDGNHIAFEVTDTGIGIAPERMHDVFDPFVRGDADAIAVGGVGLGLSIARLLVEAMDGDITLRSVVGTGTTFRVRLPLPAEDADAPTTEAGMLERETGPSLRVLVAEDNAVNRMVLCAMLEHLGHDVKVATDGGEVVPAVRAFQPHVVLMDIRMPVLDGFEATRRLRADPRFDELRVIALTANAFDEDRRACLEAGMDAFLAKPINRDDLAAALWDTSDGHGPAGMD